MSLPIPDNQQGHDSVHSTMAGTMEHHSKNPFANNGLGAVGSQWGMDFNSGNSILYSSHPAPNVVLAGLKNISQRP